MSSAVIWGMIDAEPIVFPLDVRDFNSAMILFTVPAPAARRMLPGDAFELVESEPGSAQLILVASDFRRNPWGDYDELDVAFLVRPAGASEEADGALMLRSLVNQRFSYEAGHRAMAFPRAVDQIDVTYTGEAVTFDVTVGEDRTLSLRVPRADPEDEPVSADTLAYSYVNDVAYCTTVEVEIPTGIIDPADVGIELGTGPLAAELRRLGLPRTPDFCTWGEGISARFTAPRPV
jgi:hypothetical protein